MDQISNEQFLLDNFPELSEAYPDLFNNEPLPGEADGLTSEDHFHFDEFNFEEYGATGVDTAAAQAHPQASAALPEDVAQVPYHPSLQADSSLSAPQWNNVPETTAVDHAQPTQDNEHWNDPPVGGPQITDLDPSLTDAMQNWYSTQGPADNNPESFDLSSLNEPGPVSGSGEVVEAGHGRPAKRRQYAAEPPKKDQQKTWVRQNGSTVGNSRTGKTNNFGHGDYNATTRHPLGADSWTSPATGNVFRYNQWGELMGVSFDAEVLSDFLLNHPFNRPGYRGPGRLIVWIQKMPGDSARRVETQHGLKCRVKECPTGIYQARTISAGHYRVAFDEQWTVHGIDRNPMHVAGYVHLYCMERFFNFAELCRRVDVRVDDREIEREPSGRWIAALRRETEEWTTAKNFVDFTRSRRCEHGSDARGDALHWARYPVHNPLAPTQRKQHDLTLTYRLIDAKERMTGRSKMRMMKDRPNSGTQYFVNKGDLQMQVDAQQDKAARRRQDNERKRKRRRDDADAEEEEDTTPEPKKTKSSRRQSTTPPRVSKRRSV